MAELAQMAQAAYDNAQAALKEGNWADYGKYMQQLSDILKEMAGKEE